MMDYQKARMVLLDIAADMEADATRFDGQPFTGKTVAEYMANQGAAIAALANILEKDIAERIALGLFTAGSGSANPTDKP